MVRHQQHVGMQRTHPLHTRWGGIARQQSRLLRRLNVAHQQGDLRAVADAQDTAQTVAARTRPVVLRQRMQHLKTHAVPLPALPGLAALGLAIGVPQSTHQVN